MRAAAPEAGIDDDTLAELRALDLVAGRPLLAVDCDEVLVAFVSHVMRWLPSTGHEMRLNEYRLEGSMFPHGEEVPIPFHDCVALLDRFFREETLDQAALDGAAEALEEIAAHAQVVVLTNVPRFAREHRCRNLEGLGMAHPVVVNSGGKGRALKWLAERTGAPVAFIDDSPQQLAHAARHAPEVIRIHFVGAPRLGDLLRDSPEAHHRAHDWPEALRLARDALGL